MELSKDARANKPHIKPKSLIYAEEASILAHPLHQLNSPKGVQKHMLFHYISKFLIFGGTECHNLPYKDFTQGINEAGVASIE
jgi:hypothetical protein